MKCIKLNILLGKLLYGQDTVQFLLHCNTGYFSIPVPYGCVSVSECTVFPPPIRHSSSPTPENCHQISPCILTPA